MSVEVERVARAARGDADAWKEVYTLHAPVVRRACASFAGFGEADLDELVQETFVLALQHLPTLRDQERFRPWLLAVARSRCLRRWRRRRIEERAVETLSAEESVVEPLDDERVRSERVTIVRDLIDALPAGPERETVILFYVEGRLSAREIAERLGVGKSTVTMRLERCRARVKRQLAAALCEEDDA